MTELDLSYNQRYESNQIVGAYDALILEIIKGNKASFVRNDELEASWKIFTPLLKHLENEKILPEYYENGSRGPNQLDEFIQNAGYIRTENYSWKPTTKL